MLGDIMRLGRPRPARAEDSQASRSSEPDGAPAGSRVDWRLMGGKLSYWIVGVLLSAVFILPFLWIVVSSFKGQRAIFADISPLSIWTFLVRNPVLSGYRAAIVQDHVLRALLNSVIVSVAQVLATIVLSVPAAYALTRLTFRGRSLIFTMIFVTFLVPSEAIILPLFQIVNEMRLGNTLWAVFLPFIASPFALFLLRQSFADVPKELDEAATIDGAGHLRIMLQVIVPNVKPALAAMSLMTFIFSWNAFLWPLVIIQSSSRQLVQVAIALNTVPGELPNWGAVFAGAVLAAVPVLVLFAALQRYFIRGVATSGLK